MNSGGRSSIRSRLLDESINDARAASLRYVTHSGAGLQRRRNGKGFTYRDESNRLIRDRDVLARIRSLAVPPAWTDVWICPLPNGHLQATGRDKRGRKVYRYHSRWRAVRDETKYGRMPDFGAALPRIRARVRSDLARSGLPREKVIATVVRLLETSYIRVGNDEYARDNGSFGLTTLKNRHVKVSGPSIQFRFLGKSGKRHEIQVSDRRLAKLVRRIRDLPGQLLFQYLDEEGEPHPIDSADVNDYLRATTNEDFTAKDFRTWAGTLLAASHLAKASRTRNAGPTRQRITRTVEAVAEQLGNTVPICRKSYIHPAIIQAFESEKLLDLWRRTSAVTRRRRGLTSTEAALMRFLESVTDREGRRMSRAS